jgi:hypothetical protein
MNDETLIITIAVLVVATGLFVLWYFLGKVERKNYVITVDEASVEWNDARCVKCEKTMEEGFAFAGKGINWVPKHARKPGVFSSIGSVLENTFSLRIPPAINMAWYCKSCKIIVLDNSRMLRIKNA